MYLLDRPIQRVKMGSAVTSVIGQEGDSGMLEGGNGPVEAPVGGDSPV